MVILESTKYGRRAKIIDSVTADKMLQAGTAKLIRRGVLLSIPKQQVLVVEEPSVVFATPEEDFLDEKPQEYKTRELTASHKTPRRR